MVALVGKKRKLESEQQEAAIETKQQEDNTLYLLFDACNMQFVAVLPHHLTFVDGFQTLQRAFQSQCLDGSGSGSSRRCGWLLESHVIQCPTPKYRMLTDRQRSPLVEDVLRHIGSIAPVVEQRRFRTAHDQLVRSDALDRKLDLVVNPTNLEQKNWEAYLYRRLARIVSLRMVDASPVPLYGEEPKPNPDPTRAPVNDGPACTWWKRFEAVTTV